MFKIRGGIGAVLILLVFMSFGIASVCQAEDAITVKLWTAEGLTGLRLSDGTGRILYIYKNDSPGKSTCTGECVANWPIFYTEKPVLGPRLTQAGFKLTDFTTITREDGKLQTAVRGLPLYYFAKDKMPGVATGNGAKDLWFAADPKTIPK